MTTAVAALTTAQMEVALGVDAYVAAFVAFETGEAATPLGLPLGQMVGHAAGGEPLTEVLRQPIAITTGRLNQGYAFEQALDEGLSRAVQIVDTQVHETSRVVLRTVMVEREEVIGYRRVTFGGCGACLAAATGAIHESSVALDVHPHCHCSTEPVIANVRELVQRPTGQEMFDALQPAEQDALFERRGGKQKADLIRSGEAKLSDLLSGDRTPELGKGLIETPLGDIA